MNTKRVAGRFRFRVVAASTLVVFITGCATRPPAGSSPDAAAAWQLREARSLHFSAEARAAHYVEAAALTAPRLGSGTEATPARETYNAAAAELTILLRSADSGRMWNHPLTITSTDTTYHLQLQPAAREVWSPDYFTSFEDANKVKTKLIK